MTQQSQTKKVNRADLVYRYKDNTSNINFDQLDDTFSLFNKIKNGRISLANAKNDQEKFGSYLS